MARTLSAAFVIVAFVGCGWWNSAERQINDVLDGIASRLTHDGPTGGLAAAAAAGALQQYLSPEVVVEPGPPFAPLTGRDAVVAAAARLIGVTPVLDVELVDRKIEVEGDVARVSCSLTAVMRDRAGQSTRDARDLNLTMQIVEGRWVVERVQASNVLEPVQ